MYGVFVFTFVTFYTQLDDCLLRLKHIQDVWLSLHNNGIVAFKGDLLIN